MYMVTIYFHILVCDTNEIFPEKRDRRRAGLLILLFQFYLVMFALAI
jgi:hypothetical protein